MIENDIIRYYKIDISNMDGETFNKKNVQMRKIH